VLVSVAAPGQHLVVAGDLDAASVADLRFALGAALTAGSGDLLLDCAGLRCRDAVGLGALLAAHRRAQRLGRRLVLTAVPVPLRRLLVATRLARVLHVDSASPRRERPDRAAIPSES